ncbi:MAG TPA: dienelactone hydrolase family protein [Phenylobacterium sp.]|uniref:dienelactone hydrolase family protein n=1 Tax=Phenylobacterium sp. TaxID=1871053 RepID=UPI002C30FB5F|nr:dienelactone hydrolase family protein [Phenylobacterium sp.]HSV03090.1 dienelactone hydrolase family protein [Phenylobacterium sp.]
MGETVSLRSARDGFTFGAYRAPATEARRGGLVICHAIWGVTPHLRELADGYADLGYEVLVPSLFDRFQRGFADRDTDPALMARQNGFAEASGWGAEVLDAVQAAILALQPPVFAVGFCFGGTVAWLAAGRCEGLSAVACYYGHIARHLEETPKVPVLLHFGRRDELIPPADVESIRQAYPDLAVHLYDAGHAFVAPNGYDAEAARLAGLRTLALFANHGGGRSAA